VTAKKKEKEKLSQCLWLQLICVSDCKLGIMCVLQKKGTWLCLCGWKKKLGCLEYDCKPG
jgi:hypothetical protein